MPNTLFTSDTHAFHRNIMKYSGRPFFTDEDRLLFEKAQADEEFMKVFRPSDMSIQLMNEGLIRNHNEVVTPEDTVYIVGDFGFSSMTKLINFLERLNGIKHLILGNHDQVIIKNMKEFLGEKRFTSIRDYREIHVEGQHICLFHFPIAIWHHNYKGAWHIHGHCHGSFPSSSGKRVDTGVDAPFVLGKPPYRPLFFSEIKRHMDKQTIQILDHHGPDTNP